MQRSLRVAAAVSVVVGVLSAKGGAQPLNFVFILADDLGQRDLGCYGSTFYETPRLDALAAGGMRFTSAYSACPVCSPTRASIQTGKYPARLHTTDYFGGPQPDEALTMPRFKNRRLLPPPYLERLPHEEVTIAETLKQADYVTFFAGKWHLGPKGYWPEKQGYDINIGGCGWGSPKSYFSPYGNPRLTDGPPGEHLPDRLAQETAQFIQEHRDKPFFVFLSLHDVHTPLQARPDLQAKYETKAKLVKHEGLRTIREGGRNVRQVQDHAVYAAMIEAMDQAVAKVLDALEEAGVADRTAVFFTSDNGGLSTAEGAPTANVPLRAGKGWMYEGGVRVPLIVRWPGVAAPGAVCDQYLISTDYFPTMLDMADQQSSLLAPREDSPLAERKDYTLDGVSFVPLLKGDADFHRGPIYWHYPHYGNQGGAPASAIRDGDYKLIEFLENNRLELYNLAKDLGEKTNLADVESARAQRMQQQLRQWRQAVGAQMPSPNPQAN
jgi:arylsulfatase A-like enzyme